MKTLEQRILDQFYELEDLGDMKVVEGIVEITKEEMKKFKDWCDDNEIMMNFEAEHNHTNDELLEFYLHQKSPSSDGGK